MDFTVFQNWIIITIDFGYYVRETENIKHEFPVSGDTWLINAIYSDHVCQFS